MSDHMLAARNLGLKALRRLESAHKPLTRLMKRRARAAEQEGFRRETAAVDAEIRRVGTAGVPIIAGPWLAEVGYEALYWVPFLRWFQDAYRIAPERLTVVSRGGVRDWYRGIAGGYVDLLDRYDAADLTARNDARMAAEEAGGRKQSGIGPFDQEILARVRDDLRQPDAVVLHPSLMFQLFRHVWHGNVAFDLFWSRTRYARIPPPTLAPAVHLPQRFAAVKFYTGAAMPDRPETRATLRRIVEGLAGRMPVVALDTGLVLDDHNDYLFESLPNVTSARPWMQAADNLAVQSAIVARAELFVGTCGGLAWLAPFFGCPSVAVYADDRQLTPHLFVARQAGRRAGAAEFLPLDLRAAQHVTLAL